MRSIMIATMTFLFLAFPGIGDAIAQNNTMDLTVKYDDQSDSAILEWYPSLTGQINSFEIKCYLENSSGSPEVVLTAGENDRTISIDQVTARNLYDVDFCCFTSIVAFHASLPRKISMKLDNIRVTGHLVQPVDILCDYCF